LFIYIYWGFNPSIMQNANKIDVLCTMKFWQGRFDGLWIRFKPSNKWEVAYLAFLLPIPGSSVLYVFYGIYKLVYTPKKTPSNPL